MIDNTIEKVPENDISVIRKWTLKDVDDHFKKLDKAVNTYKKSFIDIALNLYWLDETGYSNPDYANGKYANYQNIAEFASDKYGISKATTYQYIAIVKKFGKMNPDTGFIDKLDDKYKDFSSTALIVMSGMSNEQLSLCAPDMKIKELKALRDSFALEDKSKSETDNEEHSKSTSQEKKDSPKQNSNSAKLYTIKDVADFDARIKEITESIRKSLSQDNGKQYHIEIIMTWD